MIKFVTSFTLIAQRKGTRVSSLDPTLQCSQKVGLGTCSYSELY